MDRFIITIVVMLVLTYANPNFACFAKGLKMDELLIRDLHQCFKKCDEIEKNIKILKNNIILLENNIKIIDMSDGHQFIDFTQQIAFPFPGSINILEKFEISQKLKIQTHLLEEKFYTARQEFCKAHQELIRAKKLYPGFLELIKKFTKHDLLKLIQSTENELIKDATHNPQITYLKEIYDDADLHLELLDECVDFDAVPTTEEIEDTEAMLSALLEANIFLQKHWKYFFFWTNKNQIKEKEMKTKFRNRQRKIYK